MREYLAPEMVQTASIYQVLTQPLPTDVQPIVSMRFFPQKFQRGIVPWWQSSAPSSALLNTMTTINSWERYTTTYVAEMNARREQLLGRAHDLIAKYEKPLLLLCCENGDEQTVHCHRRLLRLLLIGQPPSPIYCAQCVWVEGVMLFDLPPQPPLTTFSMSTLECPKCHQVWHLKRAGVWIERTEEEEQS